LEDSVPNPSRIVVHTDLTEASDSALEHGRLLARAFKAELHVLHIVGEPLAASWTSETATKALPELHDAIDAEVRERLSQFFSETDMERLQATVAIRTGGVAEELARYAETEDADLIVLGGTRGGDALEVAKQVLERTASSIFVVRQR
jgi:nucleotide-binding universal stress UspA family protein